MCFVLFTNSNCLLCHVLCSFGYISNRVLKFEEEKPNAFKFPSYNCLLCMVIGFLKSIVFCLTCLGFVSKTHLSGCLVGRVNFSGHLRTTVGPNPKLQFDSSVIKFVCRRSSVFYRYTSSPNRPGSR